MLGLLKTIFGGKKSNSREEELSFDVVPDGQYLVKFADEKASFNEFILIIFEILDGDLKGTKVPLFFRNSEAKRVTKEATGDYISRLAFEGVSLADKLQMNLGANRGDEEFIVRTKEGYVVSVYTYDESKINTFKNKIKNDKAFRG